MLRSDRSLQDESSAFQGDGGRFHGRDSAQTASEQRRESGVVEGASRGIETDLDGRSTGVCGIRRVSSASSATIAIVLLIAGVLAAELALVPLVLILVAGKAAEIPQARPGKG